MDWEYKFVNKAPEMKSTFTSNYDMESVYDEQNRLKKIIKQEYDKIHYAKKQEKKRQYHQEKKGLSTQL